MEKGEPIRRVPDSVDGFPESWPGVAWRASSVDAMGLNANKASVAQRAVERGPSAFADSEGGVSSCAAIRRGAETQTCHRSGEGRSYTPGRSPHTDQG